MRSAATGEIQEANTRAAEMVGLSSKEDLVGRRVVTLHPDSKNELAEIHQRNLKARGAIVFDDLPIVR